MKKRQTERPPWLVPTALAVGALMIFFGYRIAVRSVPSPAMQAKQAVSVASLRLMTPFGPAFAGEMLAQRTGLFEREGLQVNLRAGESTNDPISSVVAGNDTFGVSRADTFLIARSRGAPIVAFAAGFIESNAAFYVLKKSNLRTPQDFPGHRLGRRAGDDTAIIYDALAQRLSLPRSRIPEVPVAFDLSMLLGGDVDIWPGHIGEEDYELTRKGVDYVAISPASFGIHVPGSVYFASESTISAHPQVVQHFLTALIAGWNLVYGDYAASIPKIVSFDEDRLSPDYVRFALERQREYLRPLALRFAEFSDAQWRSLQAILLTQRLIERTVDLRAAITYGFLQEAYRKPLTFAK